MNAPAQVQQLSTIEIALDKITPCPTNPRQRMNETAIAELAKNIKAVGILQPVVVRAGTKAGCYELVFGHRRYRASQLAGLKTIPAMVRDLTDKQILESQIIENLHREGVHELEEAESYERLQKEYGYTVAQLIEVTGKTQAYIYARLKLLALTPAGRNAFYDGKLSASTALLIARLPRVLQDEATKDITTGREGPLPYREAAEHIQEGYMADLKAAPFDVESTELLPKAGSCKACPKRTGNAPELFGDVKNADVCTDVNCFGTKRAAHIKIVSAEAIKQGSKVITGKEADKVWPRHYHNPNGFTKLDERCWSDAKNRTIRQIFGKDLPPPTLIENDDGELVETLPDAVVAKHLKEKGVISRSQTSRDPKAAEGDRKRKLEKSIRLAILQEIRAKWPRQLSAEDLTIITVGFYNRLWHESTKQLVALWNWPKEDSEALEKRIRELPVEDKSRLLFDMAMIPDLQINSWSTKFETPEDLLNSAKRLGVDAAGIRAQMEGDAKQKETARKAAARNAEKKKKDGAACKTKVAAKAPAKKAKASAKKPAKKASK